MSFRDKIGKELMFFDGGMGTLLQESAGDMEYSAS